MPQPFIDDLLGFIQENIKHTGEAARQANQASGEMLRGVSSPEEEQALLRSILNFAPMGAGGLAGSLSRYAQSSAKIRDFQAIKNLMPEDLAAKNQLIDMSWDLVYGQEPYQLRELITQIPNFNIYREKMQEQVRKLLGDKFPLFRGIPSDKELSLLAGGNMPKTMALSANPGAAAEFSHTGMMVEATGTPESVLFREPWSGKFAAEQAVVADPMSLLDFVIRSMTSMR